MHSRGYLRRAAISLAALLWALPAAAQTAPASGDFWSRADLFGDMGGLRSLLAPYGVTLGLTDSENLLANLAGGVKQGATMQGVTTATLDLDTAKAFGLPGGTFHISALQIHGQSLSGPYLDNLQGANGNEAPGATRLWELWYDQASPGGRFDIKIGQQSIDNEFLVSQYSGLFVNTMAGWPLIPSTDLYGGGPAYPLSSLGIRLQAKPTAALTLLAGVFDDNPGGGAFTDDAQRLDRSGALFNLNTGALFIAEAQYATRIGGFAGTYKLGGWYDTGAFPDQNISTNGLPLNDPAGSGTPLMHRGNFSLYAVADQTVWQSTADGARTLNLFGRIMGAPEDQNLVSFFFNGGLTLTAPFPSRPKDQAGIDFGIGRVSSQASAYAQGSGNPARGTEELIELTYQAQITGWLVLQPDMQYIVNPGGGIPDPAHPSQLLRNEFVLGARAVVSF